MVKKIIKIVAISELLILLTYFISFSAFINIQLAFLSSFFVMLGSSYAYRKLVNTKIEANMVDEKRDFLDEIEDPYELYDEKLDDEVINHESAPEEELDLREIVKQERKKIKTFSFDSMKQGLKGGTSFFRLLPYLFLVLAFIALKNNELLNIAIYLPSLLIGIVVGSISAKELFS
jgi:hypothetical protein